MRKYGLDSTVKSKIQPEPLPSTLYIDSEESALNAYIIYATRRMSADASTYHSSSSKILRVRSQTPAIMLQREHVVVQEYMVYLHETLSSIAIFYSLNRIQPSNTKLNALWFLGEFRSSVDRCSDWGCLGNAASRCKAAKMAVRHWGIRHQLSWTSMASSRNKAAVLVWHSSALSIQGPLLWPQSWSF